MIVQTDIQKDTQTKRPTNKGDFYIWPTLPRDNNLNKLECTFSKVTAFLARWFFCKIFY